MIIRGLVISAAAAMSLSVTPIATADPGCDPGWYNTGHGHNGVTVCAKGSGAYNAQHDQFIRSVPNLGVRSVPPQLEAQIVQLGYSLCAADKKGVNVASLHSPGMPAGWLTGMLHAAQGAGMCDDIKVPETAADRNEAAISQRLTDHVAGLNQDILNAWQPNPPDSDNDGTPDQFDNHPHEYNPSPGNH